MSKEFSAEDFIKKIHSQNLLFGIMKICLSAITAALFMGIGTNARIISTSDAYYMKREPLGSSMWIFNSEGVTIYSDDGKELKKVGSEVGLNEPSFYEVAADGHQYVWAAKSNEGKVEVFDIDTGDYAGYVPSCGNPAMEMRYLPTRQEMWMRCARASDSESGHIDVFSTNSLSTNHQGITLPGNTNYGWGLEVHSTLGNSGYASPYNAKYIYELDLSSKELVANFTLPEEINSVYEMTYSPTNRHIFGKARVCCSCGGTNKDLAECPISRYSGEKMSYPVIVKNGPSASDETQEGICGGSCEGSSADTIGVFEFDTTSKTFIANHNGVKNNGATAIVTSDGKYIILGTHDGGETVRVLKAGANGEPSTFVTDIPTNFGGVMGKETVGDIAFIEDDKRNFMVLAGWGNNEVAIVDMDNNFKMHKITLTDNAETTASGQRNVEWAVGSDYVWIDGPQASEMYIVEIGDSIESARVSKVIPDIKGGLLVHVNNYARATTQHDKHEEQDKQDKAEDDDADLTRALAIAALIVGSLSLLWTAALTLGGLTGKSAMNNARPEQAPTPMDAKTLGSKQAV